MAVRDASEVYFDLQRIADDLQALDESGRVVMDDDTWNFSHRDLASSMAQARDAIQTAIDATRWMRTLPPV